MCLQGGAKHQTDMTQRKTRLRQMAALCRATTKYTKEDVAELRGVLDLIAAEKVSRSAEFGALLE